jgi:hypothetical protein
MSRAAQLLAGLESRGIILFLDEGEVRYRSPRDALTDADRAALRAAKPDIADYLAAREAGHALRSLAPRPGPLTATVTQEMWYRFAGPPREGEPVAINISGHTILRADPDAVAAAIAVLIARHDVLRTAFQVAGETLIPSLLAAETFAVERQDMRRLSEDAAEAAVQQETLAFCRRLKPVSGGWLTQGRVTALPGGRTMAVISSSHIVSDAASRNILLDELYDMLEGRALPPVIVAHNDYGLAERDLLASPQGAGLIDHWRRWYAAQPLLTAPSSGTPLVWGTGTRIVRNFRIPRRVMARGRALAAQMKVTAFLVHLTIFCLTLARWSGRSDFPIRILGDKRNSEALSRTVGILYCGDAVDIHAAPDADFETVMRAILVAYDATLARRIPTLHYYAPQMVRPAIEAPDFPNRIPAVFNYYASGTAREKTEKESQPDASAAWPWPPDVQEMPPVTWPRISAPVFLHLMDDGADAEASLHFYQDAVPPEDQRAFTALLFQIYRDILPE